MTNHLRILVLFIIVSFCSVGQNGNGLVNELFYKAKSHCDTFFLSTNKITIDSSILLIDDLKDSLSEKQFDSFSRLIKQQSLRVTWEEDDFRNSILVDNSEFKKKIGTEYKKSVINIEDNYWWKYRFDTLYSTEVDSLMQELKDLGITPETYRTVPKYYRYIYHISNPIISEDGKFAIIQIENHSSAGYLDALSNIYLFKRINNEWKLILYKNIWIS